MARYLTRVGDDYDRIAQLWYGDRRLGEYLRKVNRSRRVAPGQVVDVPGRSVPRVGPLPAVQPDQLPSVARSVVEQARSEQRRVEAHVAAGYNPQRGDRLYVDRNGQISNSPTGGSPLYFDSKTQQATVDQTPIPYVFGMIATEEDVPGLEYLGPTAGGKLTEEVRRASAQLNLPSERHGERAAPIPVEPEVQPGVQRAMAQVAFPGAPEYKPTPQETRYDDFMRMRAELQRNRVYQIQGPGGNLQPLAVQPGSSTANVLDGIRMISTELPQGWFGASEDPKTRLGMMWVERTREALGIIPSAIWRYLTSPLVAWASGVQYAASPIPREDDPRWWAVDAETGMRLSREQLDAYKQIGRPYEFLPSQTAEMERLAQVWHEATDLYGQVQQAARQTPGTARLEYVIPTVGILLNAFRGTQERQARRETHMERVSFLRNEAWTMAKDGDFEGAQERLARAYREYGSAAVFYDPTFAYTWWRSPEKEQHFYEQLASAELQKGEPLVDSEIRAIREALVEPWLELQYQMVFDLTNLIPLGWFGKPIAQGLKATFLRGSARFWSAIDNVVLREVGELPWLARKTIRPMAEVLHYAHGTALESAASKLRSATANALGAAATGISHTVSESGEQDLVSAIETIGRVVSAGASPEDLAIVSRSVTPRHWRLFRSLAALYDPNSTLAAIKNIAPSNWGQLITEARDRAYKATLDEVHRHLVDAGRSVADASVLARREALKIAGNPMEMLDEFAENFRRAYLAKHQVLGYSILDDSLLYRVARGLGAFDKGIFGLEPRSAERLVRGWFTFSGWINSKWAYAVLALRPAWVTINLIDSTFRYLLAGGHFFDELGPLWDTMYEKIGRDMFIPAESFQAFARREAAGSVAERLAFRGQKPKFGPLSYIRENWDRLTLEHAQKGLADGASATRRIYDTLGRGILAFGEGFRDFNSAIEFTLRVRMMYQEYSKAFFQLDRFGWNTLRGRLEAIPGIAPETVATMQAIWDIAGSNPERMMELTRQLRNLGVEGRRVWSLLLPDNLTRFVGHLSPQERDLVLRPVVDKLHDMIQASFVRGEALTASKVRGAFDEILEAWDKRFDEIMTAPATHAPKGAITDITAKPADDIAPPSAEAAAAQAPPPVKPDVPVTEVKPKPEVTGYTVGKRLRSGVTSEAGLEELSDLTGLSVAELRAIAPEYETLQSPYSMAPSTWVVRGKQLRQTQFTASEASRRFLRTGRAGSTAQKLNTFKANLIQSSVDTVTRTRAGLMKWLYEVVPGPARLPAHLRGPKWQEAYAIGERVFESLDNYLKEVAQNVSKATTIKELDAVVMPSAYDILAASKIELVFDGNRFRGILMVRPDGSKLRMSAQSWPSIQLGRYIFGGDVTIDAVHRLFVEEPLTPDLIQRISQGLPPVRRTPAKKVRTAVPSVPQGPPAAIVPTPAQPVTGVRVGLSVPEGFTDNVLDLDVATLQAPPGLKSELGDLQAAVQDYAEDDGKVLLWHATTNLGSVNRTGLKSGAELAKEGIPHAGLAGSPSRISVTFSYARADLAAERLRLAARAANGEATIDEIVSAFDRWVADATGDEEGAVHDLYVLATAQEVPDGVELEELWQAAVERLEKKYRTPEERYNLVAKLDRILVDMEGEFSPSAVLLDTWENMAKIDPDQVGVMQVGMSRAPVDVDFIPQEQELRLLSQDVFAILDPKLKATIGPEQVLLTNEYDRAYRLAAESLQVVREQDPVLAELVGDYVKWFGHPDSPIDEWWRTHFPQMSERQIRELRAKAANYIMSSKTPPKGARNITQAVERLRGQAQRFVFRGAADAPPSAYILELLGFTAKDIDAIEGGWRFIGSARLAQEAERRHVAQEAWTAWVSQPSLSGKSRVELWGRDVTKDQASFSLRLQELIDEGLKNGWEQKSSEALQALRELKRQVDDWHYVEELVNVATGHPASQVLEQGLPMAQKPVWELPEGIKVWLGATENITGRYAAVHAALVEMRDFATRAVEEGLPGATRLGEGQLDLITSWIDQAVSTKQRALDIALYGSEGKKLEALGGSAYEGAVPITNRWMLDYESYSNADNAMRNVMPFWKFPSRTLPMWFQAVAEHPEILSWYQKYMRFSQRQLWQAGAITTNGEVIPSLEGHIRIPGTNMWVDLTAPLSVKYAFRMLDLVDIARGQGPYWAQEDQNASISEQVVSFLVSMGRHFGFSLSPWLTGALTLSNLTDPQRDPPMDLIPQMDLIPKWWLEDLVEKTRRVYFPNADPVRWSPRVSWEDYLIEADVLAWATSQLDQARTDREKNDIVAQVRRAFEERENNDLWLKIRTQTRRGDYWRNMSGYFIGFYAKEWTDADAELRALRNRRNQLIASIESQYGRDLIGLDTDASGAYEFYVQNRYQTPEGMLSTLYDTIRYTVGPEGEQLYGDERRLEVARRIHEDETTRAFYDSLEQLGKWLESNLDGVAVGTPGDDPQVQAIWDQYWDRRDAIETNPTYLAARRTWTVGYKPQELVYKTFRDLWWSMLYETRPRWKKEEGEEYADYQSRVAAWEESLPLLAQSRARSFLDLTIIPRVRTEGMEEKQAEQTFEVPGGREINARILLQNLVTETTQTGLQAWQTESRDTIYDALNWAYNELYYQPYIEAVTQSGYAGDLAEYDFKLEHPTPPTAAELAAKVTERYGHRFAETDLVSRAAGEQGPLSIEERRQMQMESDPTLLPYKQRVERVWNILGWSGPGSSTALMEQYRKLGGDEDLLAIWWEIGERWVRPEDKEAMAKFTEMADMLERAAQMVSLKPPTRAQLVEWVQAQGENKVFQQEVQRTFGDTIYDLLAVYRAADSQEKRQLRTIYPEIDAYYKAKDAYGELHPIWAKYYNPESTTALSSSGGTGARRRATFGRGGGGGGARPETGDYILALGKRSTLDPNDLLRNLGGGGVGGIPRWPAGFAEAAGPLGDEIIKLASQGAPLSDSGAEFLADLGDRHKEWFEFARQILLTSRRAKDRAQGRAEQGYGLPPEIP